MRAHAVLKPIASSRVALLVGALVVLIAVGAPARAEGDESEPAPETSLWEDVKSLYEKAKSTGEQVPRDVYQWIRDDLKHLGDWEYLVVEVDAGDASALETRLNELGQERWELCWAMPGDEVRYVMKRRSRTYLNHIPMSDLLGLLPAGDGGESNP